MHSHTMTLVICDFHPMTLQSLNQTFRYAGLGDCIFLRKRSRVGSNGSAREVTLPLRIVPEENPLNLGATISLLVYLILATVVGTITVIRCRLGLVVGVFAFPQGLVAFLVGKLTQRKIVVLTDGGDIDVILRNKYARLFMPRYLHHVSRVTALNRTKAKKLAAVGIKADIFPLVGIDTSRFAPVSGRNRSSIIYVGRLSKEKRPDILIKACSELKRRGLFFKAIIVGDGPLKGMLEELVTQTGLGKNVNFEGYIPHSEIEKLYRNSMIFVLPSTREGVSISLLEAMSSGCLCVVSDIPDNKEIVQDGLRGILFHVNDAHDLANKLVEAITNFEGLESNCKEARSFVREHYSLEAVAGQLISTALSEKKLVE